MLTGEAVFTALKPWLGTEFLLAHQAVERVLRHLQSYRLGKSDLLTGMAQLDDALFALVYEKTKGSMIIRLDDGSMVKLRTGDISMMADEAYYLLFCSLPHEKAAFDALKEVALRRVSLAALRALYIDFADFQTAQELEILKKTIQSCHPPFRWRQFL